MGHFRRGLGMSVGRDETRLETAMLQVATDPSASWTWESLRASATLVLTASGAPIRTIVTGRRRITTGSYASRKAGRPFPFESMNERAFLMHSEVDTCVVDYRAQPFRFEFLLDGKKRIYIADAVRLLDTGEIEVVEVKNDRRALKDPDYALKLECVAHICRQIGWRFRVVFGDALLLPEEIFANVLDVQSWRLAAYGAGDIYRVLDALEANGPTTMGALANEIGSRVVGTAKLKAMMVARIVRIDLSKLLCADTAVELVAAATPSIGKELGQ